MTAATRLAWRERTEAFARLLALIESRATATLAGLGIDVTGPDAPRDLDAATGEAARAARSKLASRDQARILAALFVRFQVQELRRRLRPGRPLEGLVLLDALESAYHIGRLDDDGILDRWIAREYRAAQAGRARAAAKAKHDHVAREVEELATAVQKIRATHPALSRTAIARLIDAAHVNRTRKRIERLDLTRWRGRRLAAVPALKKS